MDYRLISRLLGVIALTLALAFLICFGVAFVPSPIEGEVESGIGLLVCAGLTLALAAALLLLGRGAGRRILRKEALCVIGLGWLLASLVGAGPYLAVDPDRSLADAFFESASGLTTTGASIYGDVEVLPHNLLFWRALSQWLGGMGVVVFFVAILGSLGAGAKILYSNEASGSTADFDQARVQEAVLTLWLVYIGLSAACVVVYFLGGMPVYDAFCHMFATVSTGGFSTRNASLAAYQSPFLEWSATLFMLLGGTSFVLIAQICQGRSVTFRRNTEFRAYVLILACSAAVIATVLLASGASEDLHVATRSAVFQTVSIMTTTGFVTADFDLWPALPKVLLLMMMAIGGCSASTGGGIKVARIVVAVRAAIRSVEAEFRPHVVRRIQLNDKPMEDRAVNDVLLFVVLVGFLCLAAVPAMAILEPDLSLDAALSAVFACLFNVGPGFGEVGPMRNYGSLHDHTKVFLALLMIMGRLEFYAILVLFSPSLWRVFR